MLERRLRLWAGLTVGVFVTLHLANHALGLHSIGMMELFRKANGVVWPSVPGQVALYGALLWAFGLAVLPFLLIQAAWSWWQLTSANYVEHYGLLRKKLPDGRYGRSG